MRYRQCGLDLAMTLFNTVSAPSFFASKVTGCSVINPKYSSLFIFLAMNFNASLNGLSRQEIVIRSALGCAQLPPALETIRNSDSRMLSFMQSLWCVNRHGWIWIPNSSRKSVIDGVENVRWMHSVELHLRHNPLESFIVVEGSCHF